MSKAVGSAMDIIGYVEGNSLQFFHGQGETFDIFHDNFFTIYLDVLGDNKVLN